MSVLAEVISKCLLFVNRLLDEWAWVEVEEWPVGYVDECGPAYNLSGGITACGEDFIEYLEDMMHAGLQVLSQLFGAMLVMQD